MAVKGKNIRSYNYSYSDTHWNIWITGWATELMWKECTENKKIMSLFVTLLFYCST